jgi:phosphatidylinositol alpha-1,6-mannosyltransferase
MKCVFIGSDFVPKVGGIAQFMYGIMSQLPTEYVEAIAPPIPGWELFDRQQKFPIHRLLTNSKWAESTRHTKWMFPQFYRQLRKVPDVDIVICCHGTLSLMLAARLLKLTRGTPFAVFLHGMDILGVRNRSRWVYYKRLLQAADIVFPNSNMLKEVAFTAGVRPEKLHLIHPCINASELKVKIPSNELRQRLGLVGNYIILTVSRLTEAKGVDTVIEALPRVKKTLPNVHYVVIGDGPAQAALESLAEDLGVSGLVSFLGAKAHQEVANFFAMSDVFVMTPYDNSDTVNVESFGIVYLEANFLRLPVVASSAGGIGDAVKHEETGLLVAPGQPAELAQAIIRLAGDEVLSKKLVEKGYQRVVDEFTNAAAASHFLEALATHLE